MDDPVNARLDGIGDIISALENPPSVVLPRHLIDIGSWEWQHEAKFGGSTLVIP
ncbi:MAG: hypothetical protein HKL84_07940 [Acidimicrobiaceae bacterium]|nr:hypothetical protein [Acidimicrobiaceae bacterium]